MYRRRGGTIIDHSVTRSRAQELDQAAAAVSSVQATPSSGKWEICFWLLFGSFLVPLDRYAVDKYAGSPSKYEVMKC